MKMRFSILLSVIFFVSVSSDEWNTNDFMKREYSLTKPYSDDKWALLGGAIITNNYVRLTPDQQSRKGAIWSTSPCTVVSWELHVHFKVHGSGKTVSGDGMAIWYSRDRMQLGPVFGSSNNFYGLGVFFDTYTNSEESRDISFPHISVLVSNGTTGFDHDTDGQGTIMAGCDAAFRGVDHDTFVAIRYEANTLTVSTDVEGKSAWKECLRLERVHLPTSLYFGASAATGGVSDNHDIISMKLYDVGGSKEYSPQLDAISPFVENYEPKESTGKEPISSSWSALYIIFIIFLVLGIVVAAIVGIYCYYESQNSKKRFY